MFELRRIKIISLLFVALQVILLFILLSFIFRTPSSFVWPGLCLLIITLISIFFFAIILYLLNLYLENNKDLNDLVEHKNLEINKLTEIQHKNIVEKDKKKDKKETTSIIDIKKIKQEIIPNKEITEYSLETYTKELLFNVAKEVEAVQGLLFIKEGKNFNLAASYAYHAKHAPQSFQLGEGISGQAVKNKKTLYLSDIPENYMKAFSGLGISKPKYLLMLPVIHNKRAIGLIELATFRPVEDEVQNVLFSISKEVAKNIVLLSKENKQL